MSPAPNIVGYLAENPKTGDVIRAYGGIRKIRFGLGNSGKRGGVRVIYYHVTQDGLVYLLSVYPRSCGHTFYAFCCSKNGIDARKKARGVVIHTPALSDDADAHFYYNPQGDANVVAHRVAAFADMNNYLTQAAPCGSNKIRYRKIYKMYVHTT